MIVEGLIGTAIAGSAVCAACAIVRPRIWPLTVAAELVLPSALGAALMLAISLIRGEMVLALAAAATLAAASVLLFRANQSAAGRGSGARRIRIVHANLLDSAKAAARVAAWARRMNADVVALTEPPPGALSELQEIFPDFPHALQSDDPGRRRVCILSTRPIAARASPDINILCAAIDTSEGPFHLVTAHPSIPMTPRGEARRDEILARAFSAAAAFGAPAALVGDLNTTPTGPVLPRLCAQSGLRRAGDAAFGATWMAPARGIGLVIDHVFAAPGCGVVASSVGPLIPSDHRPIFAEISW